MEKVSFKYVCATSLKNRSIYRHMTTLPPGIPLPQEKISSIYTEMSVIVILGGDI